MRSAAELTDVIKIHPAGGESGVEFQEAGRVTRVGDVSAYIAQFGSDLDHATQRQELLKAIRDTRALSDDLREVLTRAVQAAKTAFTERSSADEHHDVHSEDGGEG